jgi:hypothetical protein
MLSIIRRRVTFANVAMTVALVFAMSGGAFAAGKLLITSTKQISPKVLKSLQGKAGAAGAQGPAGPAGSSGGQGPQGPQGYGGTPGAKGENGVSVTSVAASKAECAEGGTKFTSATGTSKACNGKEGAPWMAGGTLPSGRTETGVWAFGPLKQGEGTTAHVSVASFPIPLAAPLGVGHAHFINANGMEAVGIEEGVAPTECGSGIGPEVNASDPQAKPGNLCIYTAVLTNALTFSEEITGPGTEGGAAGTTGAFVLFGGFTAGTQIGSGTWAVTAE